MKLRMTILGLFWSSTVWATSPQDLLLETFETDGSYELNRAALIDHSGLGITELESALADSSWEVRLQAQIVQIWRQDPTRATQCWDSDPGITRNGMPRFAGELWRGPTGASLLLERFIQGDESTEVRAALIAGLQHTRGDWTEAIVSLLEIETEPEVREVMVDTLRYADTEGAWKGLRLAAADSEPSVRAAAMRSIGNRKDGAAGAELLLSAFSDADAQVRALAARSTGWLELSGSWESLRPLVADADPSVRLHALRSMRRIDGARTAQLAELNQLRQDPDAKVRRVATGIQTD